MGGIIKVKSRFLKSLTSIFILILLAGVSFSATYYVKNGGSDSADGLSDANAWGTISKVNNRDLSAGDKVFFKRGSSWSDTLIPKSSGSAASPITFDAYDTGNAPTVNINSNISKRRNLYILGKHDIQIRNMTFLNGTSEADAFFGNVELNNSYNIILEGVTVGGSFSKAGILIWNSSHNVLVRNSSIYGTQYPRWTVFVDGAGIIVGDYDADMNNYPHHVYITSCEVYGNSGTGIGVMESPSNEVSYCSVHDNGGAGIWVGGNSGYYSFNNIVERNDVYANSQYQDDTFGIDFLRPGNNNVIRYNKVHDQFDTYHNGGSHSVPFIPGAASYMGTGGIRFDGNTGMDVLVTTGNIARNNLVYNNFHGFEVVQFSNAQIFNNTLYNNFQDGCALTMTTLDNASLTRYASGTVFKNNVVYGQWFLVFDAYTENNEIDYNLYYSDNNKVSAWGSWDAYYLYPSNGNPSQFALWQASGKDQHSIISSNPLFVSTSEANFHVASNSPVLNAGTTSGITVPVPWRDFGGVSVPQNNVPDIGAYETFFTALAPSAPISLSLAAISHNVITLEWTDTCSYESGFKVERSLNNSSWTTIETLSANAISYSDTNGGAGLTADTLYYYRVYAYTAQGSSYSNTASIKTFQNIAPSGTTFYVDSVSGDDSNAGNSDVAPWKTLSKVNYYTYSQYAPANKFSAGTTVKLKKGGVWNETLYLWKITGTSANRITFESYGTDPNKPIICGSKQITSWSNHSGNIWKAFLNTDPGSVWFINNDDSIVWGRKNTTSVLTREADWYWDPTDPGMLYVYSASNPTISYKSIEAAAREFGVLRIWGTDVDYINIIGLEIKHTNDQGIQFRQAETGQSSSDQWIVDNNTIHHLGRQAADKSMGIDFTGTGHKISNNLVYELIGNGINSPYSAYNCVLDHNAIYNCRHHGIDIKTIGSDNSVRFNKVYIDNMSSNVTDVWGYNANGIVIGVQGYPSSANIDNTRVYGNIVYNIPSFGIMIEPLARNTQLFNNVVYNCGDANYYIDSSTEVTVVKNNIGFNSGGTVSVPSNLIISVPGSKTNKIIDYNDWFCSVPGNVFAQIEPDWTNYSNWNTYKSATGFDIHSINSNPSLESIPSDMRLRSTSPCINAGTIEGFSLPSQWLDYAGTAVPQGSRPDIGAYEYAGPVTYTITATAGDHGTISPSGTITTSEGSSTTFAMAGASGYHVLDVLVDGISVGPVSSYTFLNAAAAHTIAVSFKANRIGLGGTYYVDSSAGNDNNDGSQGTPWKTINEVNNSTFVPGASVLFKRGREWREQLTVINSGSGVSPIIFGSYGSGEKPIINGAVAVSPWQQVGSSNIYTSPLAGQPDMVFFGGIRGTAAASAVELTQDKQWFWDNNVLNIYSLASPSSIEAIVAYRSLILVAANNIVIRDLQCIHGVTAVEGTVYLYNTNNVSIESLSVHDNAGLAAIYVAPAPGIACGNNTVSNCEVYNITGSRVLLAISSALNGIGISLNGPDGTSLVNTNEVLNNTVHDCGAYGISVNGGSDNLISGNTTYLCGWSGISLTGEDQTRRNIIENNTVYENCRAKDDCAGINVFRAGNDNIVRYNIVHDQYYDTSGGRLGSAGIRFDGNTISGSHLMPSTGNRAYYNIVFNEYYGCQAYCFNNVEFSNNVIYNTANFGIWIMSDSPSEYIDHTIVKNNIVQTTTGHFIANIYTTNPDFDNNIYFPDTGTKFIWQSIGQASSESNLSGWKGHGEESHSSSAEPLFIDAANSDPAIKNFHVQSSSPAINAGANVGLTRDFAGTGVPIGSAPDIGVYEETISPTVTGSIKAAGSGSAIPNTTVLLLDTNYQNVASATTDASGNFTISAASMEGYLFVSPPVAQNAQGYWIYQYQPRFYYKPSASNSGIDIRLPQASTFIIEGRDQSNNLMDVASFEALRANVFSQYTSFVNMNDQIQPAMYWQVANSQWKAIPALMVDSSQTGGPFAVNVLFWQTASHGKIMLKADNDGSGFSLPAAGQATVINLNTELLNTVKREMVNRTSYYNTYMPGDPDIAQISSVSNLDDAVDLRDRLEYKAARAAINVIRKGTVEVTAKDLSGKPIINCTLEVAQTSHQFMFGAFEGTSRYVFHTFEADTDRKYAYSKAIEAGLSDIAPVLPAWSTTAGYDKDTIDQTWGITSLKNLGYKVKFHGTLWFNLLMIPGSELSNDPSTIASHNRTYQNTILGYFGNTDSIWESMNEPATANEINLSREAMISVLADSASALKSTGSQVLVNSPHEFDFGYKYAQYNLDNTLRTDYKLTYSDFLSRANISNVDIIGLQFYPGFHMDDAFGAAEGPAMPPYWLVDTVNKYSSFGKKIHITEFSVPSNHDSNWNTGYWKNKWDAASQAEYVGRIFTLMYGNDSVNSIIWWDMLEHESYLKYGGLLDTSNNPKPAYDSIKSLIKGSWTTTAEATTASNGKTTVTGFGGQYEILRIRLNRSATVEDPGINFYVTEEASGSNIITVPVYSITATYGTHGSITPSGQVCVIPGGNKTFAITPESGYHISDLRVNGTSVGTPPSYSLNNINSSQTVEALFAVNSVNRAPVLNRIGSKTTNEASTLIFTVSGTDEDGTALTYTMTGTPSGSTFNTSTRVFSWTPSYSQAGSYSPIFTVSDGSLTSSETVVITVNNVNRVPILNHIGNKTTSEGQILVFTVSGTDEDRDPITYEALNIPTSATFNTTSGAFSWSPNYSQSGTYGNITFEVIDSQGGTSKETITITVNNINRAPVLIWIGSKSVNENSALTFTVSGTDEDGTALTYSAASLPTGATFNAGTRVFSWTPTYNQAGSYSPIFTASDGVLTSSETVLITVNNVLRTYIITAIAGTGGGISPSGSYSTQEGTNTKFTITANSGYAILNVTADEIAQGAISSYTFTNISGNHSITAAFSLTIPSSPSGLTANTASASQINLAWTDNAINEDGFKIERSPDAITWTQIATVAAGVAAYSNTGLAENTTYYYRVRAYNSTDNSEYSNTANAKTYAGTPPTAPSNLTVGAQLYTSIALSWTDNSNNETSFVLQRKAHFNDPFVSVGTVEANIRTITDTGLTPNTAYVYQVLAFNEAGYSAASNPVIAVTLLPTPETPSNLAAVPYSENRIDLSWTDNSVYEAGFKVERSPNGTSSWTEIATVSGDTYQNTGLSANTTYYYRVYAYNTGGTSPYSNTLSAITNVPSPPTGLTSEAITQTQATLRWTDNSNIETNYIIQRKQSINDPWTNVATLGANAISYTDTGLTPNTAYLYRVFASNANGISDMSNAIILITQALPGVPATPSSLNSVVISQTQINLTWTDNANNETGYKVERSPNGTSSWAEIASLGADATAFNNTGLTATTQYFYRVYAYNAGGNSGYATGNATTLPNAPSVPSGLAAAAASQTQINLTWTDTANETGYRIQRGLSATGPWTAITTPAANAVSYNNTGLTANTTYYYRICAFNTGGDSAYSSVVNATTLPNAPSVPSGLAAVAASQTQINLTWTDTANETGYRIQRSPNGTSSWTTITTPAANAVSYSNSGLTANTTYYYRICAFNTGGDSAYSSAVNTTTLPNIPSAPTGLTATAVSAVQITIGWTDNANNEDGFKIERGPDGNSWSYITTMPTNSVGYNSMGLTPHTTYYFRVRSYNAAGNSGYSNTASATTSNRAPVLTSIGNKTTNETSTLTFTVSATDADGDTVTYEATGLPTGAVFNTTTGIFNWTPSYIQSGSHNLTFKARDLFGGITQEAVTIIVNNVLRTFVITASAGTGGSISPSGSYSTQEGTSTKFTIASNTGYSVADVVVDGASQGAIGSYTFTNVSANHTISASFSLTIPVAPSGLAATAASTVRINLAWTDNAGNENGYKIERSTDGSTWAQITTVATNTAAYSNTGLTGNTTYYYRVRAYNTAGNSVYSNISNATTLRNAPEITAVTPSSGLNTGTTSIIISGTDFVNVSDLKIGGINVQSFTVVNDTTINAVIQSGLTGSTYHITVTTAMGTSPQGTADQFTVTLPGIPLVPAGLAATASSQTQINVTWTDVTNEAGYRIKRSPNGTSSWTTITTPVANSISYNDSGLTANTAYYYRICAFNIGGDSEYSPAVSTTTLPNMVITYSINAMAGIGGTIEPSGLITVTEGGSQVFSINANNGYEIVSVKVDGISEGAVGTYNFSNVNSNHSVEAVFEKTSVGVLGPEKPVAGAFSEVTSTVIAANWVSGDSGAGTKYYCENTTSGTNSGWIEGAIYVNRGLTPDSTYGYRVKAKSAEGLESQWTLLGEQKTGAKNDFRSIKADGRDLLSGDIVGSKPNISVEIDEGKNIETLDVYVDGVKMTSSGTKGKGTIKGLEYTVEKTIPEGEHSIRIEAMDTEGGVYERQITGVTVASAGVQQIVGSVLGYPNPYDSNAGNLRISYTLTNDMDVMIYIFSTAGKVVSKGQYMSGTMGGLAGYNEVTWDGKDIFGAKVENGAYLIRVIEKNTSKQMGKCNIMVLKR
ncbi:MAG: fibronectin type III domain-containing protein [Candidatus Margulisiibacteriota bacterium]